MKRPDRKAIYTIPLTQEPTPVQEPHFCHGGQWGWLCSCSEVLDFLGPEDIIYGEPAIDDYPEESPVEGD